MRNIRPAKLSGFPNIQQPDRFLYELLLVWGTVQAMTLVGILWQSESTGPYCCIRILYKQYMWNEDEFKCTCNHFIFLISSVWGNSKVRFHSLDESCNNLFYSAFCTNTFCLKQFKSGILNFYYSGKLFCKTFKCVHNELQLIFSQFFLIYILIWK